MSINPLISIVMPSFNQVTYIERAIKSFLDQDYQYKELIVIDACSSDGSLEVIKRYATQIKYWVSEEDNGQSNAINKGLTHSEGDLICWLNSDDVMLPGALKKVAYAWQVNNNKKYSWIVGGVVLIDPKERIIKMRQARSFHSTLVKRGIQGVFGPSSFLSRELLDQYGYLNEDYHYTMDTELWIRLSNIGIRYTVVPGYIWALRLHPEAKTSGYLFPDSPMSDKNHEVWARISSEHQKIFSIHTSSSLRYWRGVGKIYTLLSPRTILSIIHSILYKGKSLVNCKF